MAKRSTRWKSLERTAAEKLGGRRVVEPWNLFRERPDVVVSDLHLVAECKAFRAFRHHTILDRVRDKYCKPGDQPVLITKSERQQGEYITLGLDFFSDLLNEIREHRRAKV